jgi:branched-chain amino acid transport system substrate-binding protein
MLRKLVRTVGSALVIAAALPQPGAQAADPIKIGAVLAVTGPVAYIGDPEAKTLEMLVEQINAKGGLLGRPVKLITYDDGGDAAAARGHAVRLVESDKVDAIIGASTSGSSMAMAPLAERGEIPMISLAGAEAIVVPVKKWVFKTAQTDRMMVLRVFEDMKARGIRKIALIAGADGFGKSGHDITVEIAAANGMTILLDETFFPKDVDMGAQLAKVRANPEVQAVFVIGAGPAPAILTKNYRQMGMTLPLYQSHGVASASFLEMAGPAAEGVRLPASAMLVAEDLPAYDGQRPASLNYIKAYQDKYGKVPPPFGGYAYDAFNLLADAIRRANSTDRPKVRDALESTSNLPGTGGTFNMSAQDHLGLDQTAFRIAEARGGAWRLAGSGK